MKNFPFPGSHRTKAEALLKEGGVGEVLFSEGTYQIEVCDCETYWPFLQVTDEGELKDSFCTCDEGEECLHLATAYLSLFQNGAQPLHVRFRNSLVNELCLIASHRHGYEAEEVKNVKEGLFECHSLTHKVLFSLKTTTKKGKKLVNELLINRPLETEETSLKFSNLPQEELELWREGEPSDHLKYELSFWSDLAKYIFLSKQAQITFEGEGLPTKIQFTLRDMDVSFYIAKVNWPKLVPKLALVESPLKVEEFKEVIVKSMHYDVEKQAFHIETIASDEAAHALSLSGGEEVGDYTFHPGKGFYLSHSPSLLQEGLIEGKKIQELLTQHTALVKKHLGGIPFHTNKRPIRYALTIDTSKDLLIRPFLFHPDDFKDPNSAIYGPWVFIPSRGFILCDGLLFEEKEKVIPFDDVSDFVTRHRLWLSEFEGFETHLLGLESRLTYSVNDEGDLTFERLNGFTSDEGTVIDYGEWVYVKGRGFYAKVKGQKESLITPKTSIKREEVAPFIRQHREELEQIEGFFSDQTPVERCGLRLSLNPKGLIATAPHVTFHPDYRPFGPKLYSEFVYVPSVGFCEIGPHLKLPDEYASPRIIDKEKEPYFVKSDLPQLQPYIVDIDPQLTAPSKLSLHLVRLSKARTEGDWHVQLEYVSALGTIPLFDVWEGVKKKKGYLFTDAGLIFLTDPRFNWLKDILKGRFSSDHKRLKLSTLEWLRLTAFESVSKPKAQTSSEKRTLKLLEQIESFQTKEKPDRTGLMSQLRPYQEIGMQWLFALYVHGLSGMLCDEMGLGKTHQAMSLIAAVLNRNPGKKILVVCPTSVIYHWEDLLAKFLPNVKALIYYGITRSLEGFEENYDVVVTSYGTVRSEKKPLGGLAFELAILDEIQIAKNKSSQTHKSLRGIPARMKLGLTGTPIENRLTELKALFDIVLPTFLPSDGVYREFFVTPIEKHYDEEKQRILGQLIGPFILRRKKEEVLKDLPERIEELAYTELSPLQKEQYKETFEQKGRPIMTNVERQGEGVPYMHIFSLLNTLKQICDHPALILGEIDKALKYPCGKWDLFVELLSEALESGQKVVVFSQFLDMLDIIEHYLKSEKISYASLRGATRDRRSQIEKFRDDPECMVFVGSLKAAGTGIDLISASIVIHYDRWWNPAKEEQATARVHRMGQKRGVQVFKLITKRSIEEHINELIERKKRLNQLIAFDDQESLKSLDREEFVTLLKQIARDT